MSLFFDNRSFTSNAFFAGKSLDSTSTLLNARQKQNALELLAVLRVFQGRGIRPSEAETILRGLGAEAFHSAWGSPSAFYWSRLAYGFSKNGDADLLVNTYAKWARVDPQNLGHVLIENLTLIALGGAILEGKSFDLSVSIHLPREGSLPGTQIAWKLEQDYQVVGVRNGNLMLTLPGNGVPLSASELSVFFHKPHISGTSIYMDVWSECVRVDFKGMERNPRLADQREIEMQAHVYSKALDVIRATVPVFYDEVKLVMQSSTPLKSNGEGLPSSSNSSIPGAMWYTETQSPELLAEMILHEFSHCKVFLIQDHDPLLDPQFHGSGWEQCEYYSPWRDDPRPLNGILHGFIVFSEAAYFWARRIETNPSGEIQVALRRLGMLTRQLELCRNVLMKHCMFTPFGAELMATIGGRISQHLAPLIRRLGTDSLPVLHMERHDQFELLGKSTVADSIATHLRKWETENGRPVS